MWSRQRRHLEICVFYFPVTSSEGKKKWVRRSLASIKRETHELANFFHSVWEQTGPSVSPSQPLVYKWSGSRGSETYTPRRVAPARLEPDPSFTISGGQGDQVWQGWLREDLARGLCHLPGCPHGCALERVEQWGTSLGLVGRRHCHPSVSSPLRSPLCGASLRSRPVWAGPCGLGLEKSLDFSPQGCRPCFWLRWCHVRLGGKMRRGNMAPSAAGIRESWLSSQPPSLELGVRAQHFCPLSSPGLEQG